MICFHLVFSRHNWSIAVIYTLLSVLGFYFEIMDYTTANRTSVARRARAPFHNSVLHPVSAWMCGAQVGGAPLHFQSYS